MCVEQNTNSEDLAVAEDQNEAIEADKNGRKKLTVTTKPPAKFLGIPGKSDSPVSPLTPGKKSALLRSRTQSYQATKIFPFNAVRYIAMHLEKERKKNTDVILEIENEATEDD